MVFKILWTVDALASLVVLYFFFVGLGDGTVSSRNMTAWILIIGTLAAILLGSIWLQRHHYTALSFIPLIVLALPTLFYLIYILMAMFGNQRWN